MESDGIYYSNKPVSLTVIITHSGSFRVSIETFPEFVNLIAFPTRF